jgi:4-hydroxybenzoate polyprenyltransferase
LAGALDLGRSDIRKDHWLLRLAPAGARPYLELARLDRPIGTWLLLLPGWWALALAPLAEPTASSPWPDWRLLLLFALGALVMRGAGCTYNDIVDRDFDARVARTAGRPLPSGRVSLRQALLFLAAQLLVGLAILLLLHPYAIALGAASLALVFSYPFMKRVTWWPQAWLGLTFNWGALMGYAALQGALSPAALALYAAGIAWTLGYDTIYAHQDKEDDALIGVKSSALLLGDKSKPAIAGFYVATIALYALVGALGSFSALYYAALAPAAAHFLWQMRRLDTEDASRCLTVFRSNREAGLLLLAPLLLEALLTFA